MILMKLKINKPIRLIELFAGIGSQAMALRDLGVEFERYKVVDLINLQLKATTQSIIPVLFLLI